MVLVLFEARLHPSHEPCSERVEIAAPLNARYCEVGCERESELVGSRARQLWLKTKTMQSEARKTLWGRENIRGTGDGTRARRLTVL